VNVLHTTPYQENCARRQDRAVGRVDVHILVGLPVCDGDGQKVESSVEIDFEQG